MAAPLEGIRVVEVANWLAAPAAAALMADLGADVIKVEPPGRGDAARALGPFPHDRPDPAASGAFLYANTSKRGLTLDLDQPQGRDLLLRLVSTYDVVIAGGTEPDLAARGLGDAALRAANPAVILTTVNGFGSHGPYAGYRWSHIVGCAMGGWSNNCGLADREPLQAGASIADLITGAHAAVATLIAVAGRRGHGRGDHVDVSGWESMITTALLPSLVYEYAGAIQERHSDFQTGPSFILPCQDGYIGLNVLTQPQWQTQCLFLGRPDMAEDPRFPTYPDRALHADEIRATLAAAVQDRTAADVFHDAQAWRLPAGLIPALSDLPNLPPNRERGFFASVDQPGVGLIQMPGIPMRFGANDPLVRPAPLLGQHTREILTTVLDLAPSAVDALARAGIV